MRVQSALKTFTGFRIAPTERSTVGRTYETENAGLGREADHGAVRWIVDPVDDPVGRDPQPERKRHLPATIDQDLIAVSVLPELYRSAVRNRAAGGAGARLFQALKPG